MWSVPFVIPHAMALASVYILQNGSFNKSVNFQKVWTSESYFPLFETFLFYNITKYLILTELHWKDWFSMLSEKDFIDLFLFKMLKFTQFTRKVKVTRTWLYFSHGLFNNCLMWALANYRQYDIAISTTFQVSQSANVCFIKNYHLNLMHRLN